MPVARLSRSAAPISTLAHCSPKEASRATGLVAPVPLDARGQRGPFFKALGSGDRMNQTLLLGIGVVTLAGILQGSFAAPMKRMPGWRWENSWLIFSLSGLIVFPWIINFATVPNVISVYSGASP